MRRRVVPALFTLLVVAGCTALGVWQLERRDWKAGLIAERAAALAATPVLPPRTREEARAMQYHLVVAEGMFLHDTKILLHAIGPKGGAGFDVLTPLREPAGRVVIVNRGFIPAEQGDPGKRAAAEPTGIVRAEGLLRMPPEQKPGWFTPDNRPSTNDWYWLDLPAMAAANGLAVVAPFYINTDRTPRPLANDHLQYALTWFSLAAAALVIYVLSQRPTWRSGSA